MKNPLKYLKHVIKDPITNIDEADARKKELMPLLYTSIGLAVAGIVGSMFLSFLTVLATIGAVGILLCLFLFFIIKRAKAKFAALTCDGCKQMMEIKTQEDYDKYVTYTINDFSHGITFSQQANSDKTGIQEISVLGSASASVIYDCTCPNCGTKNFIKYRINPLSTQKKEKYKSPLIRKEDVDSETESLVVSTLRALVIHSAKYGAVPTELEKKEVTAKKSLGKDTLTFALSDADVKLLKEEVGFALPLSSHSIHHENYGKVSVSSAVCPASGKFRSVVISYHRTIDEMAEGFFVRNELNGEISKV